jgi:undecaprenyl diphosphate synthase
MNASSDQLPASLAAIPRDRWPKHIAIIMDGNGRWARRRGLPRIEGHRRGAEVVRAIVEEAARLGLAQLTLYAFSHENWQRPKEEVAALMQIYELYLEDNLQLMMDQKIRFVNAGRRAALPASTLARVVDTERRTATNGGMRLCLAVNYGGRQELVDAARSLARDAAAGHLDPDSIDEATLAARLYPESSMDVDLLMRTANEYRVSNFLLWQISYAEIYVTDVLWPDVTEADLHAAIVDFAGRERRFGGLSPQDGARSC